MNSSQALAQSLFGNLAVHDFLRLLTAVKDDDGRPLLGEGQASSDNFSMEFHVNYLGERHPTRLDVHFSGEYQVAFECRLRELEVGPCSRPGLKPSDSNYTRDHCNGTYSKQRARTERCSFTQRGALYWKYVPQLFRWTNDRDWNPCPLCYNYQLVRNVLAVGVRPDGSVSTNNGHAVVVYDERNPAFQKGGSGLQAYETTQQALQEPTMLCKCSWQRIIGHLRNKNILSWLTEELALKYGL